MILRVEAPSETAQENTFHAVTRPRKVSELVVAFTDAGSLCTLEQQHRCYWKEEFCSVIEH